VDLKNNVASASSSAHKKRVVFIILPLLLLVVGTALLVPKYFGAVKNPLQNVPFLQKEPTVSLKTDYQNPFDKKTQYVNPFDEYKNPFVLTQ